MITTKTPTGKYCKDCGEEIENIAVTDGVNAEAYESDEQCHRCAMDEAICSI